MRATQSAARMSDVAPRTTSTGSSRRVSNSGHRSTVALSVLISGLVAAVLALSVGVLGDQPAVVYWVLALFIAGLWFALMTLLEAVKPDDFNRLERSLR